MNRRSFLSALGFGAAAVPAAAVLANTAEVAPKAVTLPPGVTGITAGHSHPITDPYHSHTLVYPNGTIVPRVVDRKLVYGVINEGTWTIYGAAHG